MANQKVFMNERFNINNAVFDRHVSFNDRRLPMSRYQVVSLQYLNSIKDPEDYSPMYTCMFAMIINIRSSIGQQSKNKVYSCGKNPPNEGEEKPYEKMISLMCFSSQPGNNAFLVLAKGRESDRLFESNVARRDAPNDNGFGPGSWVVLKKPKAISTHFGGPESGIPVLYFEPPFLLVDKSRTPFTPEAVIVKSVNSKLSCFLLRNCEIEVKDFNVENVDCKGEFCDAVDILSGNPNNPHRKCACFAMNFHRGSLLYKMDLKINYTDQAGSSYSFKTTFMSRRITNKMTGGGIPKNTDISVISGNALDDQMAEWAMKFLEAGNRVGGYTVGGWFRPGTVQDQGSSSENKVASSKILHHMTVLDFPSGWDRLRQFRCPVSLLINQDILPPIPNVNNWHQNIVRAAALAAAGRRSGIGNVAAARQRVPNVARVPPAPAAQANDAAVDEDNENAENFPNAAAAAENVEEIVDDNV